MSRKLLIISILIVLVVTILSAIVFATELNNKSILTGDKIKIETSNIYNSRNNSKFEELNNEEKLQINRALSSEMITEIISVKDIKINEMQVELYKDNINLNDIVKLSNNDIMLEINNNTGKLITFLNKKKNFPKCELNKDTIVLKAKDIFNSLNIEEQENYKMIFLEEFDDEIWRAGFAKEYEGLINPGESIRFSFAPQSNELITLSINDISYDNNSVIVTEEEALKIAKDIVDEDIKELETNMSIAIISPNYYYYKNSLKTNEIYKKINRMRKAYVCEFSNEDKTKVYVDCSTGEVIGGDMFL